MHKLKVNKKYLKWELSMFKPSLSIFSVNCGKTWSPTEYARHKALFSIWTKIQDKGHHLL